MKSSTVLSAAIVLGLGAVATRTQTVTAPTPVAAKIAIVDMQGVALSTKEGQQAFRTMQAGFDARKAALQKEQDAIQALEEKLRKGAATMASEARGTLATEIESRKRKLSYAADDLNNEAEQETAKLNQALGEKMVAVIDKYATQKGYTLVLDGNPPVVWAAQATQISGDIVQQYDQVHPVAAAAEGKK